MEKTPNGIGHFSSKIVGQRFGESKSANERQYGGMGIDVKLHRCVLGEDAALGMTKQDHPIPRIV